MSQSINQMEKPPYGIIAILLIGAFISLLNETLLNVALPSIMKDLDVTTSTVQWLSTGYMLVNGIMIPTTAFLIQRYSVRGLFLTAMTLFTAGTILAGASPVFSVLLTARIIQASGAAIMMPLLMNVLLTSFPLEKRGAAMGIFGLVMIFAPAIGPTLSGWLIEHYEWRMLFHLVTPIAAIVLIGAFFLLKDKKEKVEINLDFLSLVLSTIGFGGLLYGFSSAGDKGWDSVEVYGTIIVGAVALILFITRQFKLKTPMLEFRIFKYPMFALSSTISMVITMALFSAMLLMPIYVQTVRGISPLHSGLLMLPGALLMGVMSPITGKLFDKFGARALAVTGLTITAVTTYFFSNLELDTTYTTLITLYTLRMFGMSMVMMPVMTNGLNQLPQRFNPHGTAMNNTLQQVSGAIGSALLVTVMSNRTATHAKELAQDAMSGAGAANATAAGASQMKEQIGMQAMVQGINDAFAVSVVLVVVALILSVFMKRATPASEDEVIKEKAGREQFAK
ncbi:DHA2 family efflux MFS transporter permease subunit [Priestia megaterium]|jgi:EmrB/QacA subfamily drug resistance transporter|uniref:DHA2 family efflux MFS transporter permease subunit n=1 Tax=Priestia megaterium TaxID=1404 RepID=UPI00034DFD90|nr:DHA2 family efflux MFS transporter permease subunit [Priestia megaterium]AYE49775.1 DHA2 family efflux MFS transporter permease subunit [Priestia megaterium NCT-2]MCR8927814.1 DHA2 family efflux MFS transporter permease subunit [Priestia megaterium]UMZ31924.1 DHA2 family efflux MFS transporter permease subunit [Priestia megaterium]